MARNIKGITIEFDADTSKLDKSLREVNKNTKALDKELKGVNRALKFNPGNVDLWRQKQQILTQKVDETSKKLDILKRRQAEMDAKGVDKNSEEYRKLQREIIETESKLKRFKAQLREVGSVKLKALGEQFKAMGDKMTKAGKTLTTKLTVPLAALGTVAAKKFAEVDKTMQLTNATMGNTAEEADLLNDAMKKAAASSTYGMSDAATASLNFARAGLDAEQAAAALAPSMALAAGEGGNLDTVSGGLVATINGFHGSFDEASKYADVFANACNNTALDVDSLSKAMSVAAPIFSAAGYSVEDAALFMGVMANNGIEADKAANSLKTGLARLVSPAKDGAEKMKELGIEITNSDGTMKDSVQVQKELHDAFSTLSEAEQIAAASAIFGKNQMAPWLALINTAPGDVQDLNKALGENGTAMEMQASMMSGFAGSIEQLKSGIDVLMTSLGEALAPIIQKVVGWIQQLVDWFNALSPEMQSVIAVVGVIAAALGPVLVILGTLASAIGSIMTLMSTIGPVIAGIAGPIGIAIAGISALVAAGVWMYKNWDKVKAFAGSLKDKLVAVWNGIKTTAISAIDKVKGAFTSLKNTLSNVFNTIKAVASAAWTAIKFAITHPIDAAVLAVRIAIQKIKSFFGNLKLKLPHIKLPHFKVSGKLSLAPPSVPKLSIDWYKNGAIFKQPTIFPNGMNGIGVGDAPGGEAVLPLRELWKQMDKRYDQTGIVINVYGAPGQDVRALAEEVGRVFIEEVKRKKNAWAY